MNTFLAILTFVVFVLLLIAAGARPSSGPMSIFELDRRTVKGDEVAKRMLRREQLLADVMSLQRVLVALLFVVTILLCVATFGWLVGTLIAVFIAIEYGAIARLPFIKKHSGKLYLRAEPYILNFIEKFPSLFAVIRSVPRDSSELNIQIDSKEELQHLINQSGVALSPDEKRLIVHGLSFSDQLVSSIMTPKSVIDSINRAEFLGPLALDIIHKTGHSRLPVIDGDIDHVVGILHAQSLLALDNKRSVTAEKAMESRVLYIREDQTLQHALAAFLRTHHHLLIVINEFRETAGLITLEDVIEALLGRKIIDEFDAHDDLRAVALRNPRQNNHPRLRENV